MAPVNPPVYPPVPFPTKPLSNVSAFTYRDGDTYLERMERLTNYVDTGLVGELNEFNDELVAEVGTAIDTLVENGQQLSNELTANYNDFTVEIDALVDSINNRNGAIPVQHVTLTDDYTIVWDPTWPTNLPRTYVFSQDGAGQHTVSWPVGVDFAQAQINPVPGTQTLVNVVPLADDGTLWRAFSNYTPGNLLPTYNVRDFGAVGDGTTDDLGAFQLAENTAALFGGGTIYVPPGTYFTDGPVIKRHKVSWRGDGAATIITMYKVDGTPATQTARFAASSNMVPGYGQGASDWTMRDLTFRGSFANNATGVILQAHHSRNLEFYNIIADELIDQGHAFDLMGCDNVLFDNLTVLGMTGNRLFTEAIQTDYSTAQGFSYPEGDENYTACDGLPTINVTVRNSLFTYKRVGMVDYPCPSPMGTHLSVAEQIPRNYTFENNVVRGWVTDTTSNMRGVLHWSSGIKNLVIRGNLFENLFSSKGFLVNISRGAFLLPMAEVRNPTPPTIVASATPIVTHDFTFEGNTLRGATSGDTSNTVAVQGDHASATFSTNINIVNNYIEANYTSFWVRDTKNLTIANNTHVGGERAMFLQDIDGFTVTGNTMRDTGTVLTDGAGVRIQNCNDGVIGNNTFKNVSNPVWLQAGTNIAVQGNNLLFKPLDTVAGLGDRAVGVYASTMVAVVGNVIRATSTALYGVRATTSTYSKITGNTYSSNIGTPATSDGGTGIIIDD